VDVFVPQILFCIDINLSPPNFGNVHFTDKALEASDFPEVTRNIEYAREIYVSV
jgi:hypothetical protein